MAKNYLKAEALALVRKGDIQGGIGKWREYLAIADNAGDDDAYAALGGAHRRLGDIDQALDCYRRAYSLNPRSTYALVNLVSLQAARNTPADQAHMKQDVQQAISLCREIIEKGEATFWNWYDLATLHLIEGTADDAMKALYHAVALTPESAKENFRSVLNNLRFLCERNPAIKGLPDAIAVVEKHAA